MISDRPSTTRKLTPVVLRVCNAPVVGLVDVLLAKAGSGEEQGRFAALSVLLNGFVNRSPKYGPFRYIYFWGFRINRLQPQVRQFLGC